MSAAAQIESPSTTSNGNNSQPRKRRRRAPATGAADDCFTCSSQQLKCDRRRPYCSQCLDSGKDCSGYKTTLTWGVGVASRGKLRGLSLPIAGKQKDTSNNSASRKRTSGNDSHSSQSPQDTSANSFVSQTFPPPSAAATATSFGFVNANATTAPTVPNVSAAWTTPATSVRAAVPGIKPLEPYPQPQPLALPPSNQYSDPNVPSSATSLGHFSDAGFESPLTYSATSDDAGFLPAPPVSESRPANHKSWASMMGNNNSLSDRGSTSWPRESLNPGLGPGLNNRDFSEPLSKDEIASHPAGQYAEVPMQMKQEPDEGDDVEEVFYGNAAANADLSGSHVDNYMPSTFYDDFPDIPLALTPSFGMSSIGRTPRMQYLINYYAEVISPVIVAFDGPTNPYRTHILRLAAESDTLQHAIAALSASNLRQRRENNALSTGKTDPARRSSLAHCAMTDEAWQLQLGLLSPEEQAREELYHKGVSIQSLNAQLADPSSRRDDSILATLLVLCLFHICDTGVAKFRTQFAGVKKLLALRGTETGGGSRETKWYTRMFTWFDAMTATVNDREGQLQGVHLDVSSLSDEEWALENLAGCDGRLFKTIAKLGRLNVLSQNKQVEESPTIVSRPLSTPFNTVPVNRFDGNGWANLLADEDLFNVQEVADSRRTQFWREWREIRTTLTEWTLEPAAHTSTLDSDQFGDLANISESFRYSAFLYTERLAYPQYPSSHPNIQSLVKKALHFITMVKSDVYLLWPLFITGSECVDEQHRSVIRQRCLDIQKDSGFFNNISCLELLQKIWRSNTTGLVKEVNAEEDDNAGFKWRNVMNAEKTEGEYIVV